MLISDGGGGGDPYQIKVNSVSGGGEEQSMGYQEIMQLLHGLKPGDMTAAAASFKKLGDTLDQVTSKLRDQGTQLADSWSGEAAAKAMAKFQQLHDQAAQLAAQAHTTSGTMHWMGTEVMPKFQSLPSPQVMGHGAQAATDAAAGSAIMPGFGTAAGAVYGGFFGPDGTAKADKAAREYMKSFNQAMTQANNQLPPSTTGPKTRGGTGTFTPPGGTNGTGGISGSGSSGYSGVGGTNGTGGSAPSGYTPPAGTTGQVNLSHLHGTNTPGGSLQGYSPAGGTPSSPFTHGGGQPGSSPFQTVPVGPGGGYGSGKGLPGEGEGVPGEQGAAGEKALGEEGLKTGKGLGEEGVPGEEGLGAEGTAGAADGAAADGAAGAAGEATGAEGAAAGAAEGEGLNAMPMGGGGGGQQDKERQRQAWMAEDESIWGVPREDVGPVIG